MWGCRMGIEWAFDDMCLSLISSLPQTTTSHRRRCPLHGGARKVTTGITGLWQVFIEDACKLPSMRVTGKSHLFLDNHHLPLSTFATWSPVACEHQVCIPPHSHFFDSDHAAATLHALTQMQGNPTAAATFARADTHARQPRCSRHVCAR